MSIADTSKDAEGGQVEWLGHVHFDDGTVKEVSVLGVHKNDKAAALIDVCHAAGVNSPNQSGVKGVIVKLVGSDEPAKLYGARLRGTVAKPATNVVELRPNFSKYEVQVYPTTYSATLLSLTVEATSAVSALEAVLNTVGVHSMTHAGEYVVRRISADGSSSVSLKKGHIPSGAKGQSNLPVPVTAPYTASTPVATYSVAQQAIDEFKSLLLGERTYRVPRSTHVRKESN